MIIAVVIAIYVSNCQLTRKIFFGTSTGFKPMACALALECSTNWAMKTHTLTGSKLICWVHLNQWVEWNIDDDLNCRFVMKRPRLCLKCLIFSRSTVFPWLLLYSNMKERGECGLLVKHILLSLRRAGHGQLTTGSISETFRF